MNNLYQLARQVLSPRTGILKYVRFLPWEPGQLQLQHPIGSVPNYSQLPCGGDISRPGGSSSNFEEGLAKVIFEGLERYSAAFVDYKNLIKSKPESPLFLQGKYYPLFADWQYQQENWPFMPIRKDSEIYWAKGISLYHGESRFVPASQVYIPYQPYCPEECLGPSTSTGMAAGWNEDDALLNGLMEVAERDALMIMWMNKLSMPHLELPEDSPAIALINKRMINPNAEYYLIDLTTNLGIPTVMAILKQKAFGRELTTVGLSSKPDYETAALKAFYEAVFDYERIRVHLDEMGDDYWRPKSDFSDVTDFEWHGLSYIAPEMQQHLTFIYGSTKKARRSNIDNIQGNTSREHLLNTLAQIKSLVNDVVTVDIATRDVRSLGVHVHKVFVSGLIPVNPNHRFPWLGHERLYHVPVKLGYFSKPKDVHELNQYPHPFS